MSNIWIETKDLRFINLSIAESVSAIISDVGVTITIRFSSGTIDSLVLKDENSLSELLGMLGSSISNKQGEIINISPFEL